MSEPKLSCHTQPKADVKCASTGAPAIGFQVLLRERKSIGRHQREDRNLFASPPSGVMLMHMGCGVRNGAPSRAAVAIPVPTLRQVRSVLAPGDVAEAIGGRQRLAFVALVRDLNSTIHPHKLQTRSPGATSSCATACRHVVRRLTALHRVWQTPP